MPTANPKGYANPSLLWSPEVLRARLDDPAIKIVDLRFGERYAAGHLPGARHFSIYGINTYDSDPAPLRSFAHMWAFLLGQHGLRAEDTIIVYGEISGMTSARGFWFLEYLGHRKVHLLDGGFQGWATAGMPVERDAELPKATTYEYGTVESRCATYRDVLDAIGNSDKIILDTRSSAEYQGTDCRAERCGCVPSAVHLDWRNHLGEDGTFLPAEELRQRFATIGVTPDREVIAYCNTGYRSAHAYLALRLLDFPRVRNYVGSWQEWGNRDGMPVVKPAA